MPPGVKRVRKPLIRPRLGGGFLRLLLDNESEKRLLAVDTTPDQIG